MSRKGDRTADGNEIEKNIPAEITEENYSYWRIHSNHKHLIGLFPSSTQF
jgi:hypothetical protein